MAYNDTVSNRNINDLHAESPKLVRSCCFYGKFAQREVNVLLTLLRCNRFTLVLVIIVKRGISERRAVTNYGQPPANRTRLLCTEIEGKVFLPFVELPEMLTLLLVCNGEDASD
jgi:hypothetical protein